MSAVRNGVSVNSLFRSENAAERLGSPCCIRLSYGAVAQEDSALNSVSK